MSADFPDDSLMNKLGAQSAHKYLESVRMAESQIFDWSVLKPSPILKLLIGPHDRIRKQCSNPDPNNTTNPSHSIHTDHTTPHHTDTATQIRVIREGRE